MSQDNCQTDFQANAQNSGADERASSVMERVLEYRDAAHAENVRKIKTGIKCIFTIPAFFLILLFFTNSSRIIFLVLWIVSLFLIAAYLIHVEYSDYKIQEMVNSLKGSDSDEGIDSLIDIDGIYEKVTAPKKAVDDKIDNIITNVKADTQAKLDALSQLQSEIHEHVTAKITEAAEKAAGASQAGDKNSAEDDMPDGGGTSTEDDMSDCSEDSNTNNSQEDTRS